ncbi:hypothetical protein MNV49_002414 [Pseudohyphozyma bogoriensis]|nr:hypothetical protein MNV49_002414 [Pseudohyphozyma bogoriensis]
MPVSEDDDDFFVRKPRHRPVQPSPEVVLLTSEDGRKSRARGSSSSSATKRRRRQDSDSSDEGRGSRRKGKTVAAPRPLTRKVQEPTLVELSSSSEHENSDSDEPQGSIQLHAGDGLRAMAESAGWRGPPSTVVPPKSAPVASTRAPPQASTSRDPPPPSPKPPPRKRAKPDSASSKAKDTATSSDPSRTTTSTSSGDNSEITIPSSDQHDDEPLAAPAPHVDFWNAGPAKVVSSKGKKHEHGKATRALASLSEMRRGFDAGLAKQKQPQVEVVDDESDSGSEPQKYESVAAAQKRKAAESMAALKAKRQQKKTNNTNVDLNDPDDLVVEPAPPPRQAPPPPRPPPGKAKEKSKAAPVLCGICNQPFPKEKLSMHADVCFEREQRAQAAQARKDRNHQQPAPTKDANEAEIRAAQEAQLQAMLFDSSPPRIPAAAKGKGKAVVRAPEPVQEEEEDEFADAYGDDDFNFDGDEGYLEGGFEEDDEEEIEVLNSSSRGRGGGGGVNTKFRKGPPVDSSPPKGSIYISTMPKAVREGYERRYAEKSSPKARGSRASASSAGDGAQKMSAPKKPFRPRGGRRGGFRGGWRRKK